MQHGKMPITPHIVLLWVALKYYIIYPEIIETGLELLVKTYHQFVRKISEFRSIWTS